MTKNHADQTVVVEFTGSQTIARAEEARQRLLEALSKGAGLTIDCHGMEECDLTFLQILMATRQSCIADNRSLNLVGSPALAAACLAAGVDMAVLVTSKGE